MLISEKQQEANRQNAQHSTGPKTPEGKDAVRLNALTYGLRARALFITGEDPEEYKQLWARLEAEWLPQTPTERFYLETMTTSQWLLGRVAWGESQIYDANILLQAKLALLRDVSTQRVRLERSFSSAMRELKQLQKERKAQPQPPVEAVEARPTAQSAPPPSPPPAYVMSAGQEDHPVFAHAAPDTR